MSELGIIFKGDSNQIEKSFQTISEMFIQDKITDDIFDEAHHAYEIQKAKKDLSKLTKIKKLIYRKGKLVFGTYWVNTGVIDEDESKEGSAGILKEDVEQGQKVTVGTKKRALHGIVNGFSFEKATKKHWISIYTEEDKIEWVEVDSITNFWIEKDSEIDSSGYKEIKSLGGSTGAMLVEDQWGNKYVKKTGKDKEHIKIEYLALRLYQYMGIDVPNIHEFDEENGILYTQYLAGCETLEGKWDVMGSKQKQKVLEGFAVDALLGNWDVVGLDYDNILASLYTYDVYRVDVGGSLTKRAQGADKEFGEEVTELDTLLDPDINPTSAKIFKDVDIQDSLKNCLDRYDDIAKDLISKDSEIPDDIKLMIDKRIDYLRGRVISSPKSSINYNGKIFDIDPEYYDESIVSFYNRLNEDLIITEEDFRLYEDNHDKSFMKSIIESFRDRGDLVNEALKMGMTHEELFSIYNYTCSSSLVNGTVTKYTNTVNGNINFDIQDLIEEDKSGEEKEVEQVVRELPANSYYFTLLEAIKSLNHAKDSGNKASEMNKDKFSAAKDVHEKINAYVKQNDLDEDESVAIGELTVLYDKFKEAYKNEEKVPIIIKSENIKDITKVVKTKTVVKEVADGVKKVKVNGFKGIDKKKVAEVKILVNSLRKLEDLRLPNYYKEGVFNRGINVYKNQETFINQHKEPNNYVMHSWGSSSSWNSSGFGGNMSIKIVGKGIFIDELSSFSGNEYEILNKPFSLYKTVMFERKGGDNNVVILNKIV